MGSCCSGAIAECCGADYIIHLPPRFTVSLINQIVNFVSATLSTAKLRYERENERAATGKIGQNILIKLAMLVIILAGVRAASDILVPLLLAAFFAIVLNPLVTMLMRRGFRRGLAIGLVITVIFCALVLLGAIIASSMSEFSNLYPQLRATMEQKMTVLQHLAAGFHLNISTDALVQRSILIP